MTPTPDTVAAALVILEGTPRTLLALLEGVPREMLTRAPAGEWSVRDVVAHLAVNEGIAVERFRRIATEDEPLIANMDEEAALAASGARDRDVPTLLDEFARQRSAAVAHLRSLDAAGLARRAMHEVAGAITASELLHHRAYHDLNHVRQICSLLEAPLDEARGPLRVF